MAEFIWMRHTGHGGVTQFNVDTERAFAARGWERCEPPADEDDTTTETPAARPETKHDQGRETTNRRAARRGGDTAQEG
jgi:hypothetical protein